MLEDNKLYEAMNHLTREFYESVRDSDISPLKETVLLNFVGENPHRVWSNIYSTEDADKRNYSAKMNKYNGLCSELLTHVSAKLVPHRHYALMAHRNYVNRIEQTNNFLFQGNVNIRKHAVNKLRELEDILSVEKVNVLARGPNVDKCQTPHIDGKSFKLLLLLVDYTAGNGLYEFKYFPRSHNIGDAVKFERKIFPLRLMETIHARQGSVIAFYEKTIHGGGRGGSSPRNDEDGTNSHLNDVSSDRIIHNQYIERTKWFTSNERTLPTDVSFQLALRYGCMTDSSNHPNRTNKWMKGSTEDEDNGDGPTEIEKELKGCKNKAERELRKSDLAYMNFIALSHRVSPRRKKKRS